MERLHPRIQFIWIIKVLIFSGLVGFAATLAGMFFEIPTRAIALTVAGIIVVGTIHAIARYRHWGYEIRDDSLYLKRGVLTEVRTIVPHVRIQHVDSSRTPIERILGLASAVVYTAGSRGADVRIPGLTRTTAQTIQEQLKELAINAEGEDAV